MNARKITYWFAAELGKHVLKDYSQLGHWLHSRLENEKLEEQKKIIYAYIEENFTGHIYDALEEYFIEFTSLPDSGEINPNRLDVLDIDLFIFQDNKESSALYDALYGVNAFHTLEFVVINKVWKRDEIHLWLMATAGVGYDGVILEQNR